MKHTYRLLETKYATISTNIPCLGKFLFTCYVSHGILNKKRGNFMSKVLCFDPSGNFEEGSGTTGWASFVDGELEWFGDIKASDFETVEQYWGDVALLIKKLDPTEVVIEDYRLFGHKAKQQSWSALETPQLIGWMRMYCYEKGIPVIFQSPKDKVRVADPQLERLGVIQKVGSSYWCQGRKTNLHQRDAIRHGVFYHRYRKGK
jgi:hypothetical protein